MAESGFATGWRSPAEALRDKGPCRDLKIVVVVPIAAGIRGVMYDKFSYTKDIYA